MAKYGRKKFKPVEAMNAPYGNDTRLGDLTVADYANGMPNIRLGEMFKSLIKQLWWVVPLLILGSFGISYLTKDMKREYTGNGRILVQLGNEHTYNPVGETGTGNGLTQTIDTITLTEAALMKNDEIVQKVIEQIAPPHSEFSPDRTNSPEQNRFDRDGYTKINQADTDRERQDAIMELRNSVASKYAVAPHPKSSIIDVAFRHEDPDVAVEALKLFIDEYMAKRRSVFVEGSSELIAERREATEEQLKANEQSIANFLSRNNIGDFESELEGLQERTESLKASLNETRASISETEAALAEIEDQLRGTTRTIDIFVDDRASQRISQAELELQQLLAKYLPNSDPVRQKTVELDELRALQNSYGGKATGGRRVGPNPTHQTLTERRNEFAATADSLREREFTQQRQLNSADGKIRQLTKINPTYQNLLRERETLEGRLTSYNAKEQEALVDAQQAENRAENVKVVSTAEFANKGRDMRKWMWLGGTVAWGLVLFFLAMIRVFLDPKLYSPAQTRVIPAQQSVVADMEPLQAPIPEAVPLHQPEPPGYAPNAPAYGANPYETQPAEYGHTDQQTGYSAAGSYDPNSYVHYGDTADVYSPNQQVADPYAASSQYVENPYAGNTAVDLNHNPYATGQVQAGALSEYPGGAPNLNPYAPPQS